MAGAAQTTPMILTEPTLCFKKNFLIKNAEIVNEGDLVGMDTNGFVVVASKTAGSIIKALGVAFFEGNNSTITSRTGDGTTQRCSIARYGLMLNANTTLVPGLAKGAPVYLGPVPTSTVSNYTCNLTSTNGDAIQQVGWVSDDGTTLEIFVVEAGLKYQTAGNSTVTFA